MFFQNQLPRSVKVINHQLDDVIKLISLDIYQSPCDASSQANLLSLKRQEEELKDELKAAEWLERKVDMELTLSGSIVTDHFIPIGFLHKFLEKVQKLRLYTAEIASGIIHQNRTSHKTLLEANQLSVGGFIPSSFAIQLNYVKSLSLFDTRDYEGSGEKLFLMLLSGDSELSGNNNIFLSHKLRNHYQNFLKFFVNNDAIISTRTTSHPFSVKMTPEMAKTRKRALKNYTISEPKKDEEIIIDGILTMGDIKKHIFSITTDIKSYNGQVTHDGIIELQRFALGSKVQAKLNIKFSQDDLAKPSYLLISLQQSNS
jgi:hypothetical protein